jgi:hypothetical protein
VVARVGATPAAAMVAAPAVVVAPAEVVVPEVVPPEVAMSEVVVPGVAVPSEVAPSKVAMSEVVVPGVAVPSEVVPSGVVVPPEVVPPEVAMSEVAVPGVAVLGVAAPEVAGHVAGSARLRRQGLRPGKRRPGKRRSGKRRSGKWGMPVVVVARDGRAAPPNGAESAMPVTGTAGLDEFEKAAGVTVESGPLGVSMSGRAVSRAGCTTALVEVGTHAVANTSTECRGKATPPPRR